MLTRSAMRSSLRDGESGTCATVSQLPPQRRLLRLTAPLHPILVHFTIALTATAFASDLLASLFKLNVLIPIGWWTLAGAILVTPATLATGIISRVRLPVEEAAMRSFLRTHMALGPILFGLLIAAGIWRARLWQAGSGVTWQYLATMAAVVLVMAAQGYLGGELVYRYGAEVKARYRKLPGRSEPFPFAGGGGSAVSEPVRRS